MNIKEKTELSAHETVEIRSFHSESGELVDNDDVSDKLDKIKAKGARPRKGGGKEKWKKDVAKTKSKPFSPL